MSAVRTLQKELLNLVSASLVKEPNFNGGDERTEKMCQLVDNLAKVSPEFILKLALYTRDDLGIRTSANFLVALASTHSECRPFLKIYLKYIIRLPSDWLEISKLVWKIPNRSSRGLPNALRGPMAAKFADFDEFSLAKYNKERAVQKKKKREKLKKDNVEVDEDSEPEDNGPETLKQMIRNLHITTPKYNVLSLIGARYPSSASEFAELGLEGTYQPERAGKRMKLKVPETWETQVSLLGNKATTWETLLDHKKLPFMAMLRNLRNMLEAGISPAHHDMIIKRLTDEYQIANSRQFPFRFLSAYEAINVNLQEIASGIKKTTTKMPNGKTVVKEKKRDPPPNPPTEELVQRYRDALDVAVRLATMHNVKPIHGTTVVLVDATPDMDKPVSSAKSLATASLRTCKDVALLLGLMFHYSCEECEFHAFNSQDGGSKVIDKIDGNTILANMSYLSEQITEMEGNSKFPYHLLYSFLKDEKRIDSIVVLSNQTIGPSGDNMSSSERGGGISGFLEKYRTLVNPDLLYVAVNMGGATGVSNEQQEHPNNVALSGFSDSILKFVAERGDGQLDYVNRIKEKKGIGRGKDTADRHPPTTSNLSAAALANATDAPVQRPLSQSGGWKTLRFFISSTFTDMQGERTALTTVVFPTLRRRCAQFRLNVNLVEVDLRWGITTEEATSGMSTRLCLSEVQRCDFFVGMLGERYGWHSNDAYSLTGLDDECYGWLMHYPKGRSITELEFQQGFKKSSNCFAYVRDGSFVQGIMDPAAKKLFASESEEVTRLQDNLKQEARSQATTRDYYASYGGVVNGKPTAVGLDEFARLATEDLWSSIQAMCPSSEATETTLSEELGRFHSDILHGHLNNFTGRKNEVRKLVSFAMGQAEIPNNNRADALLVVAEEGCGKSALLSKLVHMIHNLPAAPSVYYHFIAPGPQASPTTILYLLCSSLAADFEMDLPVEYDYKSLTALLPVMLKTAGAVGNVLMVVDGLDMLDSSELKVLSALLPPQLPDNVRVVFSTTPKSPAHLALKSRTPTPMEFNLTDLCGEDREALVTSELDTFYKKLEGTQQRRGGPPPKKPERSNKPNQMGMLIGKNGAGRPLYLKFALTYLRVQGQFEKLTAQIRSLPQDLYKLVDTIFNGLEALYGQENVAEIMKFVAMASAAGCGVRDTDLKHLCTKAPQHISCAVLSLLGDILKWDEATGTVSFPHASMLAAVKKRYIRTRLEETALHTQLYRLHKEVASPADWSQCTEPNRFRALTRHGTAAKLNDLVEDMHTLTFIEASTKAGCVYDLLEGLVQLRNINGVVEKKLQDFYSLVVGNLEALVTRPHLLYQLAINMPDSTQPAQQARHLSPSTAWLKWENKDQSKGMCLLSTQAAPQKATCTTFSPKGDFVACGTADWVIRVYKVDTGNEKFALEGHKDTVTSCSYNASGDKLASVGKDCTIIVWNMSDGGMLTSWDKRAGHGKVINCCAWARTTEVLLTGADDCSIKLWEPRSQRPIQTKRVHNKPVSAVATHAHKPMWVSGSWDCTIRVWEGFGRDTKFVAVINTRMRAVRAVAMASTMVQTVAASSVDGRVKLFDVVGKQTMCTLFSWKDTGRKNPPASAIALSPDASILASTDDDGCLKVNRATSTGNDLVAVRAHAGPINGVAFAPNGTTIATAASDSYLKLWNREKVEEAPLHGARITTVAFSNTTINTNYVATGSWNGKIKVVDTTTATATFNMFCGSPVRSLCFLPPTSDSLVSGSNDGIVRVWRMSGGLGGRGDEEGGSVRFKLTGHKSVVSGVCCSPDGNQIASVSWDTDIRIWNALNGSELKHIPKAHNEELTCVAWSPNGRFIVTGALDSELKVWSTSSWSSAHQLTWTHWVTEVHFHESNLVVTSADGAVSICNVNSPDSTTDLVQPGAATKATHARWVSATKILISFDDRTSRIFASEGNVTDFWAEEAVFYAKTTICALDTQRSTRTVPSKIALGDHFGNFVLLGPKEGEAPPTLQSSEEQLLGALATAAPQQQADHPRAPAGYSAAPPPGATAQPHYQDYVQQPVYAALPEPLEWDEPKTAAERAVYRRALAAQQREYRKALREQQKQERLAKRKWAGQRQQHTAASFLPQVHLASNPNMTANQQLGTMFESLKVMGFL